MRAFAVSIIIITNFIIQSTLLQHFKVLGIIPNTALIIVVGFAILWGKSRGAMIGFFTGMLQDILLGSLLGVNAMIYMLIGYNIGTFEKNIYKDNNLTPIFFTIISTVLYHLMFYIVMYMTHNQMPILILMRKIIFPEVIYNGIVSTFVYRLLYNLTRYPNIKIKLR
ncbi:rod shape-determining protein MreD [Clostridiaceae bacterium 35-E11]